jgi:hypothetical protein
LRYLAIAIVLAACGGDDAKFPIDELQNPSTCMQCHPKHYTQWSGSMHAYASVDPVFVAMNKRGQMDTGNQLGTFCVKCHAPMAVQLGLTDGTNFDPTLLPENATGITCYFCHNVASVADTHNNGLVLALDDTMRGGLKNPVGSPAHNSTYDPLMDGDTNNSEMCGSCHDIVTPKGVELERTYLEWQTTFFTEADPTHHLTCGTCHMVSSTDVVADAPDLNVPSRNLGFHDHTFPGIDQALTPFQEQDAQAAAVTEELKGAVAVVGAAEPGSNTPTGGICVLPTGMATVRMDTILVGHAWPSGSSQDRRAWLEVKFFDAAGTVLLSSGVVPDGPPYMDPEDIADPELVGMWDRTFDDTGAPAHFFWDVARHDASNMLRPPVTLDKNSPAFDHSFTKTFNVAAIQNQIDHITARIRIRPLPYRLLTDLSLDALAPNLKTLDIQASMKMWTKDTQKNNCNFPP